MLYSMLMLMLLLLARDKYKSSVWNMSNTLQYAFGNVVLGRISEDGHDTAQWLLYDGLIEFANTYMCIVSFLPVINYCIETLFVVVEREVNYHQQQQKHRAPTTEVKVSIH